MSGNPLKIGESVDGNWEVEKATTYFINLDPDILRWREVEEGMEVLTLNEILGQTIRKNYRNNKAFKQAGVIPFIRVIYETGMWGVIFEVGQYKDAGTQWYVHGITKGYG